MSYRLFYWALRGRGEQIRLLLNALGEEYEDVHLERGQAFMEMKRRGPGTLYFGSVPMLQDGDFKLAQGPAIMNYLGRKHGVMPADARAAAKIESLVLGAEDMRMAYFRLLGKDAAERQSKFVDGDWKNRWLPAWSGLLELNGDSGFFVGNSLTQADVAIWDALDAILNWVEGARLGTFARIERFYDSMRARPAVAGYLASDRRL